MCATISNLNPIKGSVLSCLMEQNDIATESYLFFDFHLPFQNHYSNSFYFQLDQEISADTLFILDLATNRDLLHIVVEGKQICGL